MREYFLKVALPAIAFVFCWLFLTGQFSKSIFKIKKDGD